MGTHWLSGGAATSGRGTDRTRLVGTAVTLAFLALSPALAGCSSSFSSSSPAANQTAAAVPPPPNVPVAAAGQPAYAPPPGPVAAAPDATPDMLPYPKQSLFDFRSSNEPQAVAMPHPPGSYTPSGQPYTPPPGQPYTPPPGQQPAYGAPAGAAPAGGQPVAAATPAVDTDPTAHSGAYPSQSLFDLFTNKPAAQ